MNIIKRGVNKLVNFSSKLVTGDLSQKLNTASGEKQSDENTNRLIRQSAAEGCVLLKNDGALPIKDSDNLAIFGRCQYDYFYVGYGSGGDVCAPYKKSLIDGIDESSISYNKDLANVYKAWRSKSANAVDEGFWGNWPYSHEEMPLSYDIVTKYNRICNKALYVIGRAAGEDRENKLAKGSYYLTDTERANLDIICNNFNDVIVVLDCGNIIDMSWVIDYGDKINAILFAGLGGQESGNAVCDVLTGRVNPCGKLCDTIAKAYEYYPSAKNFGNKDFNNYQEDIFVGYRYFETFNKDAVLYPFGYGLSYTDFELSDFELEHDNGRLNIKLKVTNVGTCSGKEVCCVYLNAPNGKLGKASRVLVGFDKTELLKPNESQLLSFQIMDYTFASFDDTGKTGNKGCYVLEEGTYRLYVGSSVRTTNLLGEFELEDIKVYKKLKSVCGVKEPFERLVALQKDGKIVKKFERVEKSNVDLKKRILCNMPKAVGYTPNKSYQLIDVKNGKVHADDFIASLSNDELEALSRGHGAMDSSYGIAGNAGSYGGIIKSLNDKGINAIITADGPAGARIKRYASLLPCGTTLACTFNKELVRELYTSQAKELDKYGIDVALGPGMNIHRNVLCGRNFEYFSEDPLLSGVMASYVIMGIQSGGHSACPKHFACNNQEYRRNANDSRLSERALREIYLKGFEIAIKTAKPMNIMTSYNKINGVWSHYNYDLINTVLRGEWNYEGVVITDWWMQKSKSPEFPQIRDNAYRIRSGVNVLMPGNMVRPGKKYKSDGTALKNIDTDNGITRAELEQNARYVLAFVVKRMEDDSRNYDQ